MESGSQKKTDQELVLETFKDRDVFALLVERYQAPLLRYIVRLGSDREQAKDILQESFIKTYINLANYDPALSFSAWLYRIAHNEAISHFRKQKNKPRPVVDSKDLVLFEKAVDDRDLADESDSRLRSETIRTLLTLLPEQYRDVLILRYFEEKSYDEISDILLIPGGTVATNIARAKAQLKEELKKTHVNDV